VSRKVIAFRDLALEAARAGPFLTG
jgi:hypothetical protein